MINVFYKNHIYFYKRWQN